MPKVETDQRKKLKFWPKLVFFILLCFLFFSKIPSNNDKLKENIEQNDSSTNYIDILYNELKEKGIDKEFLVFIDNNYNNALEKISNILKKEDYSKGIWHKVTGYSYLVLNDLYNHEYENMDNIKIIESKSDDSTLSFVGDISLADNWYIMPKYDERNQGVEGILSKDVLEIMTKSDLMVANSEFTVSNRGKPMEGKLYTFRAKSN